MGLTLIFFIHTTNRSSLRDFTSAPEERTVYSEVNRKTWQSSVRSDPYTLNAFFNMLIIATRTKIL